MNPSSKIRQLEAFKIVNSHQPISNNLPFYNIILLMQKNNVDRAKIGKSRKESKKPKFGGKTTLQTTKGPTRMDYEAIFIYFCQLKYYPSQMQDQINKKASPGQKLCKYNGQSLGYGLYIRDNCIYCSVLGTVQAVSINNSPIYSMTNYLPSKRIGLAVGDLVYGKVLKVKEQECIIEILQVNQVPCIGREGKVLEGAIRKENVREKMIDSVVMIECFKPRDIVKAKVISLGDSLRGIYLTTASQNLGVLVAQNEQTGRLMLPFDWTTMVDPEQLIKEPRKVCRPE